MDNVSKTYADALHTAKRECLESNNIDINVSDTTDDNWLIEHKSGRCACGETSAVHVTFFDAEGGVHLPARSRAYCEDCGND